MASLEVLELHEKQDEGVKVSIRVRPHNARELEREGSNDGVWETTDASIGLGKAGNSNFDFDHVFTPPCDNGTVYSNIASGLVKSAVDGFNGVIFAYGQTSSGKTHTMLGTDSDQGITPRAVQDVFRHVTDSEDREFLLRVSYIEIYNEVIKDLLCPGQDNLKIHEDFTGRVFVDAREEVVMSAEDVLLVMKQGEEQRTFGATNMNERSSRSHTIFTVIIESRLRADLKSTDDGVAVCVSTLSLVDLAGSERVSHTGAEGVRLKEGGHINKSLLTLGTVINKLTEGATGHIPYRDSKLTRILQPALGGNARTSIICAVTPAEMHIEETLSTLKFASRAKCVHNTTSRNEILDDRAMLRRCQQEVEQLKAQLQAKVTEQTRGSSSENDELRKRLVTEETKVVELTGRVEKLSRMVVDGDGRIEEGGGELVGEKRRKKGWRRETIGTAEGFGLRRRWIGRGGRREEEEEEEVGDGRVNRLAVQLVVAEKTARNTVECAEKERRAMDVEYQALRNELVGLAAHAEEAERVRYLADVEAQKANSEVAMVEVVGLVDEIVSASIIQSEINTNHELSKSLSAKEKDKERIKKELDAVLKRERIGTAPVMKQVEVLKAKLLELEAKFKAARTTNARLEAEKMQTEKDTKALERQVRAMESMRDKDVEKATRDVERTKENELRGKVVQMDALREELDRERMERMDLDAKLISVQKTLAEVEVALKQKEVELDEAVREAELAREALQSGTESSTRAITALTSELAGNKAKIGTMEAELAELQEEKANSVQEVAELKSSCDDLRRKMAETAEMMAEVMAEKELVKAAHEHALAEHRQQKDAELIEVRAEMDRCRDKALAELTQEMTKKLEESTASAASWKAELDAARVSLEEKTTEVLRTSSELEGARIQSRTVEEELEGTKAELAAVWANLEDHMAKESVHVEQLTAVTAVVTNLEAQRAEERIHAERLANELRAAEEIAAADSKKAEEKDALQKRVLGELTDELAATTFALTNLRNEKAEHEVQELARLTSLEDQLETAKDSMETMQREREEAEAVAKAERDALGSEVHAARVALSATQQEKEDGESRHRMELDQLKDELAEAKAAVDKLKRDKADGKMEAEAEVLSLRAELHEAKAATTLLQNERKEFEAAASARDEAEMGALRTALNSTRREMETMRKQTEEAQAVRAKVRVLEEELHIMERNVTKLQGEKEEEAALRSKEVLAVQEELVTARALQGEVKSLQEELVAARVLQGEVQSLQEELVAARALQGEVESLEEKLKAARALQGEVESLEEKLEAARASQGEVESLKEALVVMEESMVKLREEKEEQAALRMQEVRAVREELMAAKAAMSEVHRGRAEEDGAAGVEVERLREREEILGEEMRLLKVNMEERMNAIRKENAKHLKDKQRLLERYHEVEKARRKLEIGLEEWRSGSGRVGTLERKLERREIQVRKRDRELKRMEERMVLDGRAKDWLDAKRVMEIESREEEALAEKALLEKRTAALDAERMALVREVDQLRDVIQERERVKLDLELRLNSLSSTSGDDIENSNTQTRRTAAKPPKCPQPRSRLALREVQNPN